LVDALAINLPAMANLYNTYNQLNIGYGINDSICSLAYSILVIMTGELFATLRTWVGR